MFELAPHQVESIQKMHNGSVLVGDVGTGKSITALAYFDQKAPRKPIIVVTTAKKRDSGEWYADAMKMSLNAEMEIVSWNSIKKFEDYTGYCFIFDEQKLVGNGAWVKSFLKIAQNNEWILLSATPADTWMDLVPVFLAHGFYRNRTDFNNQHVRFSRFAKFPKVDGYFETHILERHRKAIFVEMPFNRHTVRHEHIVNVDFDLEAQRTLYTSRWNFYDEEPIKDAGELMRLLRKSANEHESRKRELIKICESHPRVIVFYNHDYELEILRTLHTELEIPTAEWNGHNHQDIPTTERWLYLVQYQAGAEGWNCISTDTVVFYSLPYSHRNLEQAKGRVDRLNTPYIDLHYYILKSQAIIDKAIWKALRRKKNFHASAFAKQAWPKPQTKTYLN